MSDDDDTGGKKKNKIATLIASVPAHSKPWIVLAAAFVLGLIVGKFL